MTETLGKLDADLSSATKEYDSNRRTEFYLMVMQLIGILRAEDTAEYTKWRKVLPFSEITNSVVWTEEQAGLMDSDLLLDWHRVRCTIKG